MILCDTNVFIHAFGKHQATIEALRSIGFANVVLSTVSVMELYRGMGNKYELAEMQKKIRYYDILHLNAAISNVAIDLLLRFKLSHDLQIPDALIGATAITNGLPLFTYNVKD